jgi:hypothetical protein
MNAPRLKEEGTPAVLDLVQHNEVLRALLAWVTDLMAEKQPADTSIDWEDGEDHDERQRSAE